MHTDGVPYVVEVPERKQEERERLTFTKKNSIMGSSGTNGNMKKTKIVKSVAVQGKKDSISSGGKLTLKEAVSCLIKCASPRYVKKCIDEDEIRFEDRRKKVRKGESSV
jgi:hypothetical protein